MAAGIGVACSDQGQAATPEELVGWSDRAIYKAKQSGGIQFSAHEAPSGSKQPLPRYAPGNITRRVEAVELSRFLRQAVPQNHVVFRKNESDSEASVKKLTLERNGLGLSKPAKPKNPDEWSLAPRSGKELSWAPTPDPTLALQMTQTTPVSPIEIEIVVQTEISGVRKEFRRKILVGADFRNLRLDPLPPQ